MPEDTDEERAAAAQTATFGKSGNGYFVEMATRPQTIGYALLDSLVALAAWMIDHDTDAYYKIARAFVDGEPSGNLTRDYVLENHGYWLIRYWLSLAKGRPTGPTRRPRAVRLCLRRRFRSVHDIPGRDWRTPTAGSRRATRRVDFKRGRQGRPLRRLGGAGAFSSELRARSARCADRQPTGASETSRRSPHLPSRGRRPDPPRMHLDSGSESVSSCINALLLHNIPHGSHGSPRRRRVFRAGDARPRARAPGAGARRARVRLARRAAGRLARPPARPQRHGRCRPSSRTARRSPPAPTRLLLPRPRGRRRARAARGHRRRRPLRRAPARRRRLPASGTASSTRARTTTGATRCPSSPARRAG